MLAEIMTDINNHFPVSCEYDTYIIATSAGSTTITGRFVEDYMIGQYIYIKESILNDGVYQISAVASGSLTVSTVLQNETSTKGFWVYGLAIPTDFINLATEIESWVTNNSGTDGIASESIGRYSVSYKNGGGWKSIFMDRLSNYRSVYDSLNTSKRNWQNKMGCY